MIFNTLLIDRSSPEIAEFLAYRRTKEETDMFREIEARALLEKDIKKDPLVVRRKDMEVRKHNGSLVLLTGGHFLFSTGINGEDYKKQAEYLVTNILKLKSKARRRRDLHKWSRGGLVITTYLEWG